MRTCKTLCAAIVSALLCVSLSACGESLWPAASKESAVGDTHHVQPYTVHDGKDYVDIHVVILAPSPAANTASAKKNTTEPDSSQSSTADDIQGTVDSVTQQQLNVMQTSITQAGMNAILVQANGDAGGQQRSVQDAIARNASVIIATLDKPDGWVDTLIQARKAGIPVILNSSKLSVGAHEQQVNPQLLYAGTLCWPNTDTHAVPECAADIRRYHNEHSEQAGNDVDTMQAAHNFTDFIINVVNDTEHVRTLLIPMP